MIGGRVNGGLGVALLAHCVLRAFSFGRDGFSEGQLAVRVSGKTAGKRHVRVRPTSLGAGLLAVPVHA